MDDRKRGIQLDVRRDPLHPDRFEVEFWPNEMMLASGATGQLQATDRGTVVTVEDQAGLKVIAFHAAEKQYNDLQRTDYEEMAFEAVWEHILKK